MKQNEKANNIEEDDSDNEVGLVCYTIDQQESESKWIADSGASQHMTKSVNGLTNVRAVNQTVQVGNGQRIMCTKIGTWKGV